MELGPLLLLIALLVVVMAGSGLGFGRRQLPAPIRLLFQTGTIFILVGWAIGPEGCNVMTEGILRQLGPVLYIALGWIGFLYGSHFEWRRVRQFAGRSYGAAFSEAFLCLVVVSGVAWLFLPYLHEGELATGLRLAESLMLGVCAAGTAPAGIYLLSTERRMSRPNFQLLQFVSSVDDLPALALLGMVCVPLHPEATAFGIWGYLLWFALSVCFGVIVGVAMHWVFPRGYDVRHSSLVLLALVSLASGAAAALKLSPLLICVLSGIVFANLSTRKENAYGLLVKGEHSLYVVFLLLAGMMFDFQWEHFWLLVPAFVLLRGLAKMAGGWLCRRILGSDPEVSKAIGVGLLFQGGMTLAIVVSLEHAYKELSAYVTTTIVLSVLVNELITPIIAGKVLAARRHR